MTVRPSHEDGHLIVAAVRVLTHRSAKPPTPEAVADLLGLAPEFVRNVIISLGEEGILKVIENPFEIRAEVADHLNLEGLTKESAAPSIQSELDEFVKRRKQKVEDTEKMLNLDEMGKKKKAKMSKLEEEMKKMKGPPPPFK